MYSNYKNAFAQTFAVLAVVQFLSSNKSLITSLLLTILILTSEDVQAKETKEENKSLPTSNKSIFLLCCLSSIFREVPIASDSPTHFLPILKI